MKKLLMAVLLLGISSTLIFAVIPGHVAVDGDCHAEWEAGLKKDKPISAVDNSIQDILVYHFTNNK